MTPADYRMDEDRQVRSVTAALLLSAEGVAQRRLGKRAARSQKGVSAWRSGATARTAGGARGTARGRRDPALRTDPGSSPGVYATPSAKCSSAPSARAALLLSMRWGSRDRPTPPGAVPQAGRTSPRRPACSAYEDDPPTASQRRGADCTLAMQETRAAIALVARCASRRSRPSATAPLGCKKEARRRESAGYSVAWPRATSGPNWRSRHPPGVRRTEHQPGQHPAPSRPRGRLEASHAAVVPVPTRRAPREWRNPTGAVAIAAVAFMVGLSRGRPRAPGRPIRSGSLPRWLNRPASRPAGCLDGMWRAKAR